MKRILAFGTFDILHPGHIYFLRAANKLGDYLIVSLAREKFVRKIKKHPTFHSEQDRKKIVQALEMVDRAVLGAKQDYLGHIVRLKPDIIALGHDQKAFTKDLEKKLRERGHSVKVVRIKPYKPRTYKSSKLFKL